MKSSRYAAIWAVPAARTVLLLGVACRAPLFGAMVLLTLHVVERIDPRYTAAGVISTAATLAVAVSGPWRGRLLDRQGLRRTLLPSLIILPPLWAIAPWVGYVPLLIMVVIAGLFTVPQFSLVRQALLESVGIGLRKPALSIDSVLTEICFMTGPALAIWLSTLWGTAWVLMGFQLASVAAGGLLFWINPALRAETTERTPGAELETDTPVAAPAGLAPGQLSAESDDPEVASTTGDTLAAPRRRIGPRLPRLRRPAWMTPGVIAVLGITVSVTTALGATDLGVVAGLREMDRPTAIGWVLAVWGFGSAVGGFTFGLLSRSIPSWVVVLGLGATTALTAVATSPVSMAAWLLLAGLFCAPSFTATTVELSERVPEHARGEAFGWQGSMSTLGSAASAPFLGFAIDRLGWQASFWAGGSATALVALAAGAVLITHRARRRRPMLGRC